MYKKHSIEERLLAVKKCLRGQAPKYVGHKMGIEPHYVSEWLERYKKDGLSGIQKHPLKRADFAEKCKIVCEYAEKGVPLQRNSEIGDRLRVTGDGNREQNNLGAKMRPKRKQSSEICLEKICRQVFFAKNLYLKSRSDFLIFFAKKLNL